MSMSPAPEESLASSVAMGGFHWVQVSRPFEIVTHQVLKLDQPWIEDAVRSAADPRQGTPQAVGVSGEVALHVRVRVERPCLAQGFFALPMEWEVTGSELPPILRGELEVLPAGPAEARVGVRMLPPSEWLPEEDEELAQTHRAVNATTTAFLNRLFWTLEALSRHDPLPDGERTTPLG